MDHEDDKVAIRIWDLPVRIFHWVLVAIFVFQAVTGWIGGYIMELHLASGYALLVGVVFRVIWGFVGGTHARFASFIAGPMATLRFARRLFSKQAVPQLGHNPLGGWSVILMLASLAVQGITGLMAYDGVVTEGPLAKVVGIEASSIASEVHRWNFWVLVVLSCLHILAVLFHWLVKKDNLMAPMFTGVKQVPRSFLRERREARRGSAPRRSASREFANYHEAGLRRAVIALGAALALVALVVSLPG
ncbi:MAG TPA: cytochrome b/b6 domain-containing protein [Usitatibacter sp.]|nr:cytochrome b/b6 domain-containing protein [Usitatibacter sp.]